MTMFLWDDFETTITILRIKGAVVVAGWFKKAVAS